MNRRGVTQCSSAWRHPRPPRPRHVYSAALNGFSATLSADQLEELQADPSVARIEQNAEVHADGTQSGATWGIDATHPDFTGRAQIAFDATGGNGVDCNGHGTHVAGTIGGATWGVAKNVALRGVRVLDCGGSGTWEAVIAGMDRVAANHAPSAVANMSLGGGFNQPVNDAATRPADSGVFTGIAAGNSSTDACSFSPASAAGALYESSQGDVASATLNAWIQAAAVPNVIGGVPAGTPNLLLQTGGL